MQNMYFVFSDIEVTEVPKRQRAFDFLVTDSGSVLASEPVSVVQIGQIIFLEICFYPTDAYFNRKCLTGPYIT